MMAGAGVAWWRYRLDARDASAAFGRVFDDVDGRPQPLSQWRGRWIVLNFWATWCAPCVEEMPMLQQVARQYGPRGLVVVGVGIDNARAIRRFQEELKLDLPLLVAGAGGSALARDLGNPSGALPYTVLISPQGRIEQAHLGLLKPELLRSWLDTRLAG
jgi:thiol-disulfide isomerase/thioredoxin